MKKKERLTSSMLIHRWVNRQILEGKSGRYSCDKKHFYFDSTIIAYFKDKKTIIVDKSFNRRGSYNTGQTSFSFHQSAPEDIKVLGFNILPHNVTYAGQVPWAVKEFISCTYSYLACLSLYKDFANNNYRRIPPYYSFNALTIIIVQVLKNIESNISKRAFKKLLNTNLNTSVYYKDYKGWGANNFIYLQSVKIQLTFRELLEGKCTTLFTEEELATIDFKIWRHGVRYDKFKYTIQQDRIVFNNPVLKKERETLVEEYKAAIEKKRVEFEKELNKKKLLNTLLSLEAWRDFKTQRLNYSPYPFLRYNKFTQVVETSYGVKIHEDFAKKALQYFKNSALDIPINSTIDNWVIRRVALNLFPVIENDNYKEIEQKCIVIGCHTIPEIEINQFLKFFKLDW